MTTDPTTHSLDAAKRIVAAAGIRWATNPRYPGEPGDAPTLAECIATAVAEVFDTMRATTARQVEEAYKAGRESAAKGWPAIYARPLATPPCRRCGLPMDPERVCSGSGFTLMCSD